MLKRFVGSVRQTVKEYWRNLMHSAKNNKFSQGASNVLHSTTHAMKDQWRRKDNVKKPHHKD